MTKAGERLLAGAREALEVVRGERRAAAITVMGRRYVPDPTDVASDRNFLEEPVLRFSYRNHAGKVSDRRVVPVGTWYGTTRWHPDEPGYFLKAFDLDHEAYRDFAMADMLGPPSDPAG